MLFAPLLPSVPFPVWVKMWVRGLEPTSQNDYTVAKEE